jgi:hypothetical protein
LFIDVFQNTILGLLSETMKDLMQQALDQIGGFNPNPVLALDAPYHHAPVPYKLQ